MLINWLVGPALMTGLAWATLPDLPSYRNGARPVLACVHILAGQWPIATRLFAQRVCATPSCRAGHAFLTACADERLHAALQRAIQVLKYLNIQPVGNQGAGPEEPKGGLDPPCEEPSCSIALGCWNCAGQQPGNAPSLRGVS